MSATTEQRVESVSSLKWVPIPLMRVSPLAQRELKPYRVDKIVANFDIEELGTPVVNKRNGFFYIIDGQHRIEALKEIGYGDQQIQCRCYEGISEKDEADKFLALNDSLAVSAFDKFRIAVLAGWEDESAIERIVRDQNCRISKEKTEGAIGAVASLRKVYEQGGEEVLAATIRIIRDAYGSAGLTGYPIDGIGLLVGRYGDELNEQHAIERLGKVMGGVNGLLSKSEVIRRGTGVARAHAIAAAAVEVINAGRGGGKLTPWFRN